nr:hypothetical protein [Luteimonas sp. Y-2-2-4F]
MRIILLAFVGLASIRLDFASLLATDKKINKDELLHLIVRP